MSSTKSLIALTMITKDKGNRMTGLPEEILVAFINYKAKITKKYTLISLVNYRNKFFGRKFIQVYLDVLIRLLSNFLSCKFGEFT
jgi:hypothetical protein